MLVAKGPWAFPADWLEVYWVQSRWRAKPCFADFIWALYCPGSGAWTCFCSEKHIRKRDEKEAYFLCSVCFWSTHHWNNSVLSMHLEKCLPWVCTGSSSLNAWWYHRVGLHHPPESRYWKSQHYPLAQSLTALLWLCQCHTVGNS